MIGPNHMTAVCISAAFQFQITALSAVNIMHRCGPNALPVTAK